MTYLVSKYGDVYIPEIYGCDTWGTNSQDSIEKKKKHWYFHSWRAGNEYIEDNTYSDKLNVKLETTDLSEVINYLRKTKLSGQEIIEKLDSLQEDINRFIEFEKWLLKVEEVEL